MSMHADQDDLDALPTGVYAGKGEFICLKPGDLPVRSRFKSSREDCGAERITARDLSRRSPLSAPVPSRYSSSGRVSCLLAPRWHKNLRRFAQRFVSRGGVG